MLVKLKTNKITFQSSVLWDVIMDNGKKKNNTLWEPTWKIAEWVSQDNQNLDYSSEIKIKDTLNEVCAIEL